MESTRSAMILGCSGSIGTTALTYIESMTQDQQIQVVALSAHNNSHELIRRAKQFHCKAVCLTGGTADAFATLVEALPSVKCYHGPVELLKMIEETPCDVVLNGIVGAAGLEPSLKVLQTGTDLALANKETIVEGGQFIFAEAAKHNARLIPVDSEHSAINALINAHGRDSVESVVITASGGPFRLLPIEQFPSITPEQAVAHPTWKMGAKISVDSATLANKGLEVIEASYLFSLDANVIEVTVHPQSIVHSMVRLIDGAVYAQMSPSDMTLPIMSALSGDAIDLRHVVRPLSFSDLTLSFGAPDFEKFPLLAIAYQCVRQQGSTCIAFNAADEVAVGAFLERRCSFTDIGHTVQSVLQHDWSQPATSLGAVQEADRNARALAKQLLGISG